MKLWLLSMSSMLNNFYFFSVDVSECCDSAAGMVNVTTVVVF
jgi:hypothetical protein